MNRPDLLVFCYEDQPFIRYVLDWILHDRWKKSYALTTDLQEAQAWEGPIFGYSPTDPGIHPWIPALPSSPGHDNTTTFPDVVCEGGQFWLYPLKSANASFPADLLLGAFWMLSRVEETLSDQADEHGRFPGNASLAFQYQFLRKPVVDEWVQRLGTTLQRHHPSFRVPEISSAVQPTFDIDFTWRYLHKSRGRQVKTLIRDMVMEGPRAFLEGLKVILKMTGDPYHLYDEWVDQQAVLFFPLGDQTHFDRNHYWRHPAYQQLIRSCHEQTKIGLHPSYGSMDHPAQLEMECERFASITGSRPIRSRQHYLRARLPQTYRALLSCGIQEDWTMGYADQPGFRAGTAHSFLWFDLEKNKTSALRIYPFQVMDATLLHYLRLSAPEAKQLIRALWLDVQKTGGDLTTLAHNNSIAGVDHEWKGWRTIWPNHKE
ncbi:MAG: polysaccharide deacetylase family protein [Saprospiraceae bacterium]|nr:polysaccharide deacetylase family protein [Saprospiraceae bacterium]